MNVSGTSPFSIEQAPSPTGSLSHTPISNTVHRLLDYLPTETAEGVRAVTAEIDRLRAELERSVEVFKISLGGYDFSDYADKLSYSNEKIKEILEKNILSSPELKSTFYGYLDRISQGKSSEFRKLMEDKLLQELGLIDTVYEYDDTVATVKKKIAGLLKQTGIYEPDDHIPLKWGNAQIPRKHVYILRIVFDDKEYIFRQLKSLLQSGKKHVYIGASDISKNISFDDLEFLLSEMGKYGVKSVNFSGNNLGVYPAENLNRMLEQAGKSGIRHLNLANNPFYHHDVEGIVDFVRRLGKSGIRNLSLNGSQLDTVLDAEGWIKLVIQAGKSGIKCLDIGLQGLGHVFDRESLLQFVRAAGKSGVRSLLMFGNGLSPLFNGESLCDLVREAGSFGIRTLGLSSNQFYDICTAEDVIRILEQAMESGIMMLDVSFNGLTALLNRKQKSRVNKILRKRQYHIHR